jgi:hypothetical protein
MRVSSSRFPRLCEVEPSLCRRGSAPALSPTVLVRDQLFDHIHATMVSTRAGAGRSTIDAVGWLALWLEERVRRNGSHCKKTTIVALARKLLVALWKYVTAGVVTRVSGRDCLDHVLIFGARHLRQILLHILPIAIRAARIYRWTRMRRCDERSSDAKPLSPRQFCLGYIISTRGHDFRERQPFQGDQVKSLFNSPLRASFPARLAAALLSNRVGISGPVNLPPPCLRRGCPVLHDDRIVGALIIQFVHWGIMGRTSINS